MEVESSLLEPWVSLFGKTHAADACCECAFGPHMIFPHVHKQTRRCYSHVSLKMSKYYRQNICNLLLKLTILVKSILSCLSSKTINKGIAQQRPDGNSDDDGDELNSVQMGDVVLSPTMPLPQLERSSISSRLFFTASASYAICSSFNFQWKRGSTLVSFSSSLYLAYQFLSGDEPIIYYDSSWLNKLLPVSVQTTKPILGTEQKSLG